jgi:hypothetical protein
MRELVARAHRSIAPCPLVPFIKQADPATLPHVYWGIEKKLRIRTVYEHISGEPTERKMRLFLIPQRTRLIIQCCKKAIRSLKQRRDKVMRSLSNIRHALQPRRRPVPPKEKELGGWREDPATPRQVARLMAWEIDVPDDLNKFQAKQLIWIEARRRFKEDA